MFYSAIITDGAGLFKEKLLNGHKAFKESADNPLHSAEQTRSGTGEKKQKIEKIRFTSAEL